MAGNNNDKTGSKSRRQPDPIGEALRRLHDEVAAEPVPQDFLDLLDQIDARLGELEGPDAEPADRDLA